MNCLLINEQDTKTGPITPREKEEWGFPMNTVYYFCNIILILEGRQVCNFVVNAKASNSNWIAQFIDLLPFSGPKSVRNIPGEFYKLRERGQYGIKFATHA